MKAISAKGHEVDVFSIGEQVKNQCMMAEMMRIQNDGFSALSNLPKYLSGLEATFKTDGATLNRTQFLKYPKKL